MVSCACILRVNSTAQSTATSDLQEKSVGTRIRLSTGAQWAAANSVVTISQSCIGGSFSLSQFRRSLHKLTPPQLSIDMQFLYNQNTHIYFNLSCYFLLQLLVKIPLEIQRRSAKRRSTSRVGVLCGLCSLSLRNHGSKRGRPVITEHGVLLRRFPSST